MKITYDLDVLPQRKGRRGIKSEETLALIAFLADGKKRNMKIDYDTEKQAKTKYDSMRKWMGDNKLKDVLDIYAVDTCVVVVKLKKPGTKKAAPGVTSTEGD